MGLTTRQWIHLGLDLLGCIPVIGIAANAVNAVLYFQEGDILSGLLSVAGAVIGIGGLAVPSEQQKESVPLQTAILPL